MVQYQDGSGHKNRNYWKLDIYPATEYDDAAVRRFFRNKFNIKIDTTVKRSRLEYLLSRVERNMILYEACTDEELQQFASQRDIATTRSTRWTIARLEAADENPRFTKFDELPPELRKHVYRYNTQFGRQSSQGLQIKHDEFLPPSPLCQVSRSVRREALPVFYEHTAPILTVFPRTWEAKFSTSPYTIPKLAHLAEHIHKINIDFAIAQHSTGVVADGRKVVGRYRFLIQFCDDQRVRILFEGPTDNSTVFPAWQGKVETLAKYAKDKLGFMAMRSDVRVLESDGAAFVKIAKGVLEGRLQGNEKPYSLAHVL